MGRVYLPLGMGQNSSSAYFYYMSNEIFVAVQRVMLPLEIALVARASEARASRIREQALQLGVVVRRKKKLIKLHWPRLPRLHLPSAAHVHPPSV